MARRGLPTTPCVLKSSPPWKWLERSSPKLPLKSSGKSNGTPNSTSSACAFMGMAWQSILNTYTMNNNLFFIPSAKLAQKIDLLKPMTSFPSLFSHFPALPFR